jgi:membrane protease YdiL (CAAX protease family)
VDSPDRETERHADAAATPATSRIARTWNAIPALLRATLAAMAILVIGQLPPGLFLLIALHTTPALPWFVFATAAWLWLSWRWLDGRGPPRRSSAQRHTNLRATRLDARTWLLALAAGGFGMACVLGIALLTGLVATLPEAAYRAPFDVSSFPAWTVLAIFLQLALVAGVVEEAAFRGYLISIVERRHGWLVAIVAAALLFWIVHLSHAYATPAFIPFFAAYSVLHGTLVWATRSIVPSVVLHAIGDFTILPMQYGVIRDPLGSSVPAHVALVATCGVATLLLFVVLVGRQKRLRFGTTVPGASGGAPPP